ASRAAGVAPGVRRRLVEQRVLLVAPTERTRAGGCDLQRLLGFGPPICGNQAQAIEEREQEAKGPISVRTALVLDLGREAPQPEVVVQCRECERDVGQLEGTPR